MLRIFLIILLLSITVSAIPQDNKTNVYQYDDLIYEKLYLHIDRMMYSPGEDVWFKIYLVSGIDHRLINGNKNVYIQLIDSHGNVVDNRLILTVNGTAIGDFKLQNDLQDGYYTIRAYTKYQKNFGEESYFHKKIWVSGIGSAVTRPESDQLSQIEFGLYPESGVLIQNASNTIAFKANDFNGHGIDISGHIISDQGDTITQFKSEFQGMGSFKFMPKEGRTYFAKLTEYPDYSFTFNNIMADGATLQFLDNGRSLMFAIVRNLKNNTKKQYRLKASHKGYAIINESVEVDNFYHELTYAKKRFPLGISRITLTNDKGDILAERLIFVKAGLFNNIRIQPDDSAYNNRSEVEVLLSANLEPTDSIPAGLSVSVVNENYLNRKGLDSNLPGFLLIDSELKGFIESSASFFTNENISSSRKLDLLMMVQGWRSYFWPEIKTIASKNPDGWVDIGLTVSGRVKRLFRNKYLEGAKVTLGPVSPGLLKKDTTTDQTGYYSFENLYLLDSSLLLLEATNKKDLKFTELSPDPLYEPETAVNHKFIDNYVPKPLVTGSFYSDNFFMLQAIRRHAVLTGNLWLEEVTIEKETPTSFFEGNRREFGSWLGTPDKSYDLKRDPNSYLDIYDFFETINTGVIVRGDMLTIRGSNSIVMVDGMPYNFTLDQINMSEIEFIDIHTNAVSLAAAGDLSIGGIISLYTRIGEINKQDNYIRGRHIEYVNGFQVPRSFYSPTYTPENIDDINPDFRPTLYWNPYVLLDENKTTTLEFFTADFHSNYVIIVEGISAKGRICTGIEQFSVGAD